MKIIVTESQSRILIDPEFDIWFKRRFHEETMNHFISKAEINNPTLCDDFYDEYEFADHVMDEAIDDFLTMYPEDIWDSSRSSDLMDYVRKNVREWHSERLLNVYRETCDEYNK